VDKGIDLHTGKELLGHSSMQTTLRYMHLSARRTAAIVNPYDTLLQSEPGQQQGNKKAASKR
jgi:integrase/recombinase XerD